MAKKFPRNEEIAIRRILKSCERVGLASQAIYQYAKGGSKIEGPSIRLAEALAQSWGNMDSGIRELEQNNGSSLVESYAWDLETNTRNSKIFTVSHLRHTKERDYQVTDPREIYELVANNGSRRLRACILGVIPGDVVDLAVQACTETMLKATKTDSDTINRLVGAFEAIGISREMIEARIQRKLDAITTQNIVDLRKVYASIKDGVAAPLDFFDLSTPKNQQTLGTPEVIQTEIQTEEDHGLSELFKDGGL